MLACIFSFKSFSYVYDGIQIFPFSLSHSLEVYIVWEFVTSTTFIRKFASLIVIIVGNTGVWRESLQLRYIRMDQKIIFQKRCYKYFYVLAR